MKKDGTRVKFGGLFHIYYFCNKKNDYEKRFIKILSLL